MADTAVACWDLIITMAQQLFELHVMSGVTNEQDRSIDTHTCEQLRDT